MRLVGAAVVVPGLSVYVVELVLLVDALVVMV